MTRAFVPSSLRGVRFCAEDRPLESACQFVPEVFRLPHGHEADWCRCNSICVGHERRPGRAVGGEAAGGRAVFKNIQVLKGLPVDDFMDTMGIMSAALGWDCVGMSYRRRHRYRQLGSRHRQEAHGAPNDADGGRHQRTNFGGRQVVTCWTCHRGRDLPVAMPTIDTVYGEPLLDADDDRHAILSRRAVRRSDSGQISAGARRRRAAVGVTSYIATGTSEGFRGFGGGGTFKSSRKRQISARRLSSSPKTSAGRMPFARSMAPPDGCRRRSQSYPVCARRQ